MFETAEYKEECKKKVIDLLSQGKDSGYLRKKYKIWDWQYNQNPFGKKVRKGIMVVEKGKVVGFNGLMPVKLKYLDNIIDACWSLDTILDPTCRGKGYGGKLVDVVKKCSPVVMGLGISDIQAYINRKQGYKVCHEIEAYHYILKPNNLKNLIKKLHQYMQIIKNIAYRPIKRDLHVSIVGASNIPKQIDSLWEKVKDGYSKIIIRDYSYIKWKYGNHPLAKYQLIVIERGNELVGLGVFIKNSNVSRLVDYVGPSKGSQIKYSIIRSFKTICSSSRLLSCICTDEELKKCLEILGFIRYKSAPRFYVYSNIKNDRNPGSNWFIMRGDSDGDFAEV